MRDTEDWLGQRGPERGPRERPLKRSRETALEHRCAVAPPFNGRSLEPDGPSLELNGRTLEPDGRSLELDGCSMELDGWSLEPCGRPLEPCGRSLEPCGRSLEPCGRSLEPGGWSLSFAGCGFQSLYYLGALSALLEREPELVLGANRFSGASSGCLVAAALAVGVSLMDLCSDLVAMAAEARPLPLSVLSPSFSLLRRARDALVRSLPVDAHVRASGRLHVSLTRISDRRNVIVSEFRSREELVQVLLCSCFFPVYCGFIPPTYRGQCYMDGALSNNQPLFESRNTVTFAPFSGESDICPKETGYSFILVCFANVSIEVNTGNVYRVWTSFIPQTPQVLMQMCFSGYSDALRFLHSSGLDKGRSQKRTLNCGLNAGTLPEMRRVLLSAFSDSALRPSHFSEPPVGSKVLDVVLALVLSLLRLVLLPLGLLLHLLLRVLFLSSSRSPSSNLHQEKAAFGEEKMEPLESKDVK